MLWATLNDPQAKLVIREQITLEYAGWCMLMDTTSHHQLWMMKVEPITDYKTITFQLSLTVAAFLILKNHRVRTMIIKNRQGCASNLCFQLLVCLMSKWILILPIHQCHCPKCWSFLCCWICLESREVSMFLVKLHTFQEGCAVVMGCLNNSNKLEAIVIQSLHHSTTRKQGKTYTCNTVWSKPIW